MLKFLASLRRSAVFDRADEFDVIHAAAAAVSLVGRLDRATIRATAVHRFGQDRIVDEHVTVHEQTVIAPDGGGLNARP